MKRPYILYFLTTNLIVVLCSLLNAQRHEVDSLLSIIKKTSSDSLRSIQYLHLSTAYTQFSPDSAYKSAILANSHAQKSLDSILLFYSTHQAGLCAADLGLYEKALEYQQKALKYNVHPTKTNAAGPMAAIANIFALRKDFKSALRYGEQALRIFENKKDTMAWMNQLTNLGSFYAETDQYTKAMECHQKVLLYSLSYSSHFQRIANNNIGRLYLLQNQATKAIPFFAKCLTMSIESNDVEGQILGYANIGKAHLELNDGKSALDNYRKSLVKANYFGDPGYKEMIYKGLSASYEKNGDYKNALSTLKEYHSLYDSLEQSLNTDKYLKLESTFKLKEKEVELSQSELKLTQQKNQRNAILWSMLGLGTAAFVYLWFARKRTALVKTELERKLKQELEEAKRLQELDALKTNFFVNISHELRTPLTLIESPLLAIINKKIPIVKEASYLKLIASQTTKMKTLINQLLDLAKIEAGQTDFNPSIQRLDLILLQCAAPFQEYALHNDFIFQTEGLENHVKTNLDISKIKTVVDNLLSNAFKYTPPGPKSMVKLTMRADSSIIEIVISDNGIGISSEDIPHLFDRYFQAKPQSGSSGIGLALCQEFVHLHKGKITVASVEGRGSVFTIVLPPATEIVISQKKEIPEPSSLDASKPILLIVEDNHELLDFMITLLSDQYNIITANDGLNGWNKAFEEVPDLIISDVMMPIMDGIALSRKLQENNATSHIPVFLLTAKTDHQYQLEGLESGAIDYISKPFDPVVLQHKLANALRLRSKYKYVDKNSEQKEDNAQKLNKRDEEFLNNLFQQIEIGYPNPDYSIEDIGKSLFLSRSQVYRKVVALTGLSPLDLLRNKRLESAQKLLLEKKGTASEIGYLVGFNSPAYFVKCYREKYGITPGQILTQIQH